VQHEICVEKVLVIGRLSTEGITKVAFGGSQVTCERVAVQDCPFQRAWR